MYEEYITALYDVFQMLNKLADHKRDQRLKVICLCIFNYIKFIAKEHDVSIANNRSVNADNEINVAIIYEYMNAHSIEPYDFSNIRMEDVNVNDTKDLERFVLSHIYYLIQK